MVTSSNIDGFTLVSVNFCLVNFIIVSLFALDISVYYSCVLEDYSRVLQNIHILTTTRSVIFICTKILKEVQHYLTIQCKKICTFCHCWLYPCIPHYQQLPDTCYSKAKIVRPSCYIPTWVYLFLLTYS